MKKVYQKPTVEMIHFNYEDIVTCSGCGHEDHGDNGHHYGWGDPQSGHGNDGGHGHNHGGHGHH